MPWYRVAAIDDVKPDMPVAVTIGAGQLAVYRIGDTFHAMEDVCPHAYALLSTGFIEDDCVECPLHSAKFHILTGKCLAPPANRDLTTFPVKVEADDIFVELQVQSAFPGV
jgi:NAD(P)H-dependent nitrite reductase small subunit